MHSILICFFLAAASAPTPPAFDLAGTLVDSAGQPVAGATLWLTQNHATRKTTSNDKGAYAFPNVGAGYVAIVSRKDGNAVGGVNMSVIGPADDITLTLGLPESVSLRIMDTRFEPVAGAYVRGLVLGGTLRVPVEDLVGEGFPSPRSDDSGTLTIGDLPKGALVSVLVGHRDYADSFVPGMIARGQEQEALICSGVLVRGRVTGEGGKEGVARAQVSFFGSGPEMLTQTLSDREGFYRAVVPRGECRVTASHADYASPPPAPLSFQKDGDSDTIADIVLLTPHVVEGIVLNPDGTPAPAVRIAYIVDKNVYDEVPTLVDGSFRFCVPTGKGIVRTFPLAWAMTENAPDAIVIVDAEPRISLPAIKLKALPSVAGAVLDPDGKPAANALVKVLDEDYPILVITDEQGRFSMQFRQVPPDGKMHFRAEHALRFLRADFDVDFRDVKPVQTTLAQFTPNLDPCQPARARNNLSQLVGKPAPALDCSKWHNSDTLTLEGLRGKVIVLVFWGGFDLQGSGRGQIDELRALYNLLKNTDDVAFVSVCDAGMDPETIEEQLKTAGILFPVGQDKEPYVTFERYHVKMLPQTVVIDKQGILRYYDVRGRLLELIKSLRRK